MFQTGPALKAQALFHATVLPESCLLLFRLMGVLRLNMPNLTRTMTLEESKKVAKVYVSTGTGLAGFPGEFYQTFQEQRATCNLNCSSAWRKKLQIIFYKASRTLTPKHDEDNILQIKIRYKSIIIH